MKNSMTSLEGPKLMSSRTYRDSRGFFSILLDQDQISRHHMPKEFSQTCFSYSEPGVLRGLHFQRRPAQGKYICPVQGRIFDVAVDLRRNSSTFGKWQSFDLSSDSGTALWLPKGFAHGFCVIGDQPALVSYLIDGEYTPDSESGIRFDDPRLGIPWPIAIPRLSDRDLAWPAFTTETSIDL